MPKKYPPLKLREVTEILESNGFTIGRTRGSHAQYETEIDGKKILVTVDLAKDDFDEFLIKSMIRQSGLSREKFYGSCKSAARKIGL